MFQSAAPRIISLAPDLKSRDCADGPKPYKGSNYIIYQCTWKPNHGISCCKGSWPLASLHASTDLGVPCESPALVALPPLADQHRQYLYAGPSFGHLTPRNSREGSFSLIAATLLPSIMPMLSTLQHALHARSTRACMRILDTPSIHPKIMGTYAIGRVKVNSRN